MRWALLALLAGCYPLPEQQLPPIAVTPGQPVGIFQLNGESIMSPLGDPWTCFAGFAASIPDGGSQLQVFCQPR